MTTSDSNHIIHYKAVTTDTWWLQADMDSGQARVGHALSHTLGDPHINV